MTRTRPPLWLLVLVTMSGTLAMHMFVPALPYAARDLSASVGQTQMTISLYIIGLAIGQLFYGPLSDALGRRPMLMVGLSLYTLSGIAAVFAFNLHMLVAARLFQALGGCAGLALGRAIVRDTADAERVVSQLALMNLMMMMGPGLAPMLGSAVADALGWRAVFGVLAALGALALFSALRLLPETGQPSGRFSAGILLRDYRALLGSARFVGFALGGGVATTSVYAFIASAPFIFVEQLHRPLHEVGYYLGLMIFGMSVGNALTSRLIRRVSLDRLLLGGNLLSLCSAVALLLLAVDGRLSVAGVVGLMFLFTCGVGFTGPAALTRALGSDPRLVGSAAGLYGFTQMMCGAISTSFASLGSDAAVSASAVLAGAVALGQLGFWLSIRRERAFSSE
ncbi:multidrug effflux MFS transporter [Pseudomonas mangiferae]|nr:multidrug effflux MFS transporter [Pseudomonas mangiferae]